MTSSIADPVEFRRHLPRQISAQLHDTQRLAVLLGRAVAQGWDVKQLAQECSRDLLGTANAGGVVMYRLDKAAAHPPVGQPAAVPGPKRPFCSPECQENAGWVLDEDRRPSHRCECRSAS